ncbi:MAG: hypothetical protein O7B26_10015, partial [Planctomycetota bacterium]|nr:hypothetical protein [Planctomycetota bacterium]
GPSAGKQVPRIAIRDFAAVTIMGVFGDCVCPGPDWTDDQWAKLRAEAREAISNYRQFNNHAGPK